MGADAPRRSPPKCWFARRWSLRMPADTGSQPASQCGAAAVAGLLAMMEACSDPSIFSLTVQAEMLYPLV
jgi:hypothetical protein